MIRTTIGWLAFGFPLALVLPTDASAIGGHGGSRKASGSYSGPRGGGTFESKVDRRRGSAERTTTWENERGEGKRTARRRWDPATEEESYEKTTTGAGGRTVTNEGTVTRNPDGSLRKTGTITGPRDRSTDIEVTVTKDGE